MGLSSANWLKSLLRYLGVLGAATGRHAISTPRGHGSISTVKAFGRSRTAATRRWAASSSARQSFQRATPPITQAPPDPGTLHLRSAKRLRCSAQWGHHFPWRLNVCASRWACSRSLQVRAGFPRWGLSFPRLRTRTRTPFFAFWTPFK